MTKLAMSFLALLACLLCLVAASAEAGPAETRFVDLDGDGINDNLTDGNDDGIPDEFVGDKSEAGPAMAASGNSMGGMFDAVDVASADPMADFSVMERYKVRQRAVRDLCSFRGGFYAGEDFGPGNGIAVGTSGKVCVGGICF